LCAIAHLRGHRSAMVNLMEFTVGEANMKNQPKSTDLVVLSLFFLMASFVTLSGVLGPWQLWFR
jgi:hypothetical protein